MSTKEGQEKKPQIPDQLDRMKNRLSQLEKVIGDLRTHLHPVSRAPTSAKESPPEVEENLVDLANSIRDGTCRIGEATSEIVLMLQLLEL